MIAIAILCGLILACCAYASIAPYPFQSKRVGGLTFVRIELAGYRLSYSYSARKIYRLDPIAHRLLYRALARESVR